MDSLFLRVSPSCFLRNRNLGELFGISTHNNCLQASSPYYSLAQNVKLKSENINFYRERTGIDEKLAPL